VIVVRVLYLIAPLVLAGVVHAVVIKRDLLPWLERPLDGGRRFRGRPLFGANKTWRGVVVMACGCTAGTLIELGLRQFDTFAGIELVWLTLPSALALGLALGLGYSLAELPNSFLKRRLGIGPGQVSATQSRVQYLADQGDSALGGTCAIAFFLPVPHVLAMVFAVGLGLHVVFDRLLYATGVKERQ
jgi:CDP-2,3-bis-(O-geranylgeranyl)-sn-glycerol synthase